jgi:hypothetical protein
MTARRVRGRIRPAAVLVAAALVGVGCGSSDAPSKGTARAAVLAFLDDMAAAPAKSCATLDPSLETGLRLVVLNHLVVAGLTPAQRHAFRTRTAQRTKTCTTMLHTLASQLASRSTAIRRSAATLPLQHEKGSPVWTIGPGENWVVVDHGDSWRILGWNRVAAGG